jgi:hypothetical protein
MWWKWWPGTDARIGVDRLGMGPEGGAKYRDRTVAMIPLAVVRINLRSGSPFSSI